LQDGGGHFGEESIFADSERPARKQQAVEERDSEDHASGGGDGGGSVVGVGVGLVGEAEQPLQSTGEYPHPPAETFWV
jgi:hypothetical protein